MFGSDFFAGNRSRLRQLFTGKAPIVLTAHGLLQRGGDETFDFHQDRSFWYLTGIDEPDIVLVMDKDKEYLIVPERELVREQFDGAINTDELARHSGIREILPSKEGWRRLEGRIKRVRHVATLAANPAYFDVFGMYSNPARAALIARLKEMHSEVELLDLRPHLARMRSVKQDVELEAIQRAVDITIETLKEIHRPRQFSKYAVEYEIEADLSRGFRRRGATGHAFTPIVAGGPRACMLHYQANNSPLASDELVILDVGAQYDHYAADIARTWAIGAQPSRRQQQVYEAVAEAADHAFSLLKPGVLLKDYEKKMEQFVGEKLRELGLIKTIDRDSVRFFFPHATSHFLGLDTHDGGDYQMPLEPGAVLAVEPGIYIPEEGIGVRIEDDVVITNDGMRNLSAALTWNLS